jgi:hypothetical protein
MDPSRDHAFGVSEVESRRVQVVRQARGHQVGPESRCGREQRRQSSPSDNPVRICVCEQPEFFVPRRMRESTAGNYRLLWESAQMGVLIRV